jgi:hypothetical protein
MKKFLNRIEKIKVEMAQINEMRPGSLSEQYNVCGNPTCRCKNKNNPQKHGPYHQLSYTWKGKSTSEFVREQDIDAVKEQLANYRRFMELRDEWIECCIQLAKLRKKK